MTSYMVYNLVSLFIGLGVAVFGVFKVKNIYIKAGAVSIGTLAMGFPLTVFVWVWGYPSFIIGLILTWPIMVGHFLVFGVFGHGMEDFGIPYLEYFLYAFFQYLGYLGLLFFIRWIKPRVSKLKKKAG